jgi:hypothetical protein
LGGKWEGEQECRQEALDTKAQPVQTLYLTSHARHFAAF